MGADKDKKKRSKVAAAAEDADGDPGPSGRKWTLSIAVPGSVLDACPSPDYAAYVAGQIARAAVNFQVDEVVVYDDTATSSASIGPGSTAGATVSNGTALLAQLLQFLETPPHLRRSLLNPTTHPGYRIASSLPPLAVPHHVRGGLGGRAVRGVVPEWMPYWEGVVLKSEAGSGSYVDVGLDRMVWLEAQLPPSTRVTVHLGDSGAEVTKFMAAYSETMIVGQLAPPSAPRERIGLYWGFNVRIALGLPRVLIDCPYRSSGYDLTIGSSPKGAATDPTSLVLPSFRHALVVFGASDADLNLLLERDKDWGSKSPQDVFNLVLDTSPHLGALVLRPEDALPMALSYLITPLLRFGKQ